MNQTLVEKDVLDFINDSKERLASDLASFHEADVAATIKAGKIESPIEQMMCAALLAVFKANRDRADYPTFFRVVPQIPIGKYRVDFLVHYMRFSDPTLTRNPVTTIKTCIVECDGHDFHERNKTQARKDKARDRFLQAEGYPVLRFTGSEIVAGAHKCAEEVYDFLSAQDISKTGVVNG